MPQDSSTNRRSLHVLSGSDRLEQWRREARMEPTRPTRPVASAPNAETAQPAAATAEPAAATAEHAAPRSLRQKSIEAMVIEVLRTIYDPEIPVSIYELGLIYGIDVSEDGHVHIRMTLTAPACPVAGSLPPAVKHRVEQIPDVKSAEVELVWDPPWTRDRMSEAAKLQLGMF